MAKRWMVVVAACALLQCACALAAAAAPSPQDAKPITSMPPSPEAGLLVPSGMPLFTSPIVEYVPVPVAVAPDMADFEMAPEAMDPFYRFAYAPPAVPQQIAPFPTAMQLPVYGNIPPLQRVDMPHMATVPHLHAMTPAMAEHEHASDAHVHRMRFKRPVSTAVFNSELPSNQQQPAHASPAPVATASLAATSSPVPVTSAAAASSSPAAPEASPLPSNSDEEDASHLMRFASASEALFPAYEQTRASYEGRRRMVPYGGFDMTMNPYRRPNSDRVGTIFFTPKMSNAGIMGPDDGLNIAAILNTQRLNLLSQLHQRIYGGVFGVGGPGWQHFSRMYRPYGVNPYMGPFSYYTPPPFPPEGGFPPFAPPAGQAASPPTGSSGAASAAPPGTPGPAPGPAQAAQAAADAGVAKK